MNRRLVVGLLVLLGCGNGRGTYVEPPRKPQLTVTPATASMSWGTGENSVATWVVRSSGNGEPTRPTGTEALEATIGNGQLIAITTEPAYVDRTLPEMLCGPFTWYLWARAADGTFAAEPAILRSLVGAHTIAPSVEVTNLSAVFDGANVRLTWSPPEASTAFEGVTVVRRVGAAPTSVLDGVTLYSGPSSMVRDPVANLSGSAPTYYGVFNCNQCGKCGETAPSVMVVAPQDGGSNLALSDFAVALSADGQRVELSWNTTASKVKVLRSLNGTPSSTTDASATVVFDGAGTSANERLDGLLPNMPLEARRYTYAAWACLDAVCATTPSKANFEFTLSQALKGGGYTLFFRHGTANTCVDNTALGTASTATVPNWWKSCDATCGTATAAQLTAAASDPELAAVHAFFTSKGIVVSRVLTSEFCRARATATGFDLGVTTLENEQALTYFVYEESNRCRDTSSLLNAKPAMGSNTVHVGHGDFTGACTTLDSLNFAEAAVFKPTLGAPPKYIARVGWSQWAALP